MDGRAPVTLDRNENHYGPAPACLASLRALGPELLHDYPRDFQTGSYSRLSRRLAEMHGVEESNVILGYGCEDILKNVVHHFVARGGTLLVPSASWWYYRAVADEVGGRAVEYPLVEGATSYRYDLEALLDARDRAPVQLLLLATPNNPTGNAISRGDLSVVLRRYRDIPTVLDQAYFGFVENGPDDWADLLHEFPNLIILRSFSKLYALAGARIGYAVAGAGFAEFTKLTARNLGYNRVSENLALAALDSTAYYARVRRNMAADRARICASLRALPGVRAYDSEANFVLARFPEETTAAVDAGLRRRGLIVKFFKERGFLDCARITIGTPPETARLVAAIAAALPALFRAVA